MGRFAQTAGTQFLQDMMYQPNYEMEMALAAQQVKSDALDKSFSSLSEYDAGPTFKGWQEQQDKTLGAFNDSMTPIIEQLQKDPNSVKAMRELKKKQAEAKVLFSSGELGMQTRLYNEHQSYLAQRQQEIADETDPIKKSYMQLKLNQYQAETQNRVSQGYDKDFRLNGYNDYFDAQKSLEDIDVEAMKYNFSKIDTVNPVIKVDGKFVEIQPSQIGKNGKYTDEQGVEYDVFQSKQAKLQALGGLRHQFQTTGTETKGYFQKQIVRIAEQTLDNPAYMASLRDDYERFGHGQGFATFDEFAKAQVAKEVDKFASQYAAVTDQKDIRKDYKDDWALTRDKQNRDWAMKSDLLRQKQKLDYALFVGKKEYETAEKLKETVKANTIQLTKKLFSPDELDNLEKSIVITERRLAADKIYQEELATVKKSLEEARKKATRAIPRSRDGKIRFSPRTKEERDALAKYLQIQKTFQDLQQNAPMPPITEDERLLHAKKLGVFNEAFKNLNLGKEGTAIKKAYLNVQDTEKQKEYKKAFYALRRFNNLYTDPDPEKEAIRMSFKLSQEKIVKQYENDQALLEKHKEKLSTLGEKLEEASVVDYSAIALDKNSTLGKTLLNQINEVGAYGVTVYKSQDRIAPWAQGLLPGDRGQQAVKSGKWFGNNREVTDNLINTLFAKNKERLKLKGIADIFEEETLHAVTREGKIYYEGTIRADILEEEGGLEDSKGNDLEPTIIFSLPNNSGVEDIKNLMSEQGKTDVEMRDQYEQFVDIPYGQNMRIVNTTEAAWKTALSFPGSDGNRVASPAMSFNENKDILYRIVKNKNGDVYTELSKNGGELYTKIDFIPKVVYDPKTGEYSLSETEGHELNSFGAIKKHLVGLLKYFPDAVPKIEDNE